MFALTHSDLQARKLLSPGTHYAAGANIDAAVMTLSLKLHKDDATKGQVSCANFVLSQALMYEDDLKSRLAPPSSSQSGQSSQEFDVLIGDKELEQTMGFGEGQEQEQE
jgi:hypothetical protein